MGACRECFNLFQRIYWFFFNKSFRFKWSIIGDCFKKGRTHVIGDTFGYVPCWFVGHIIRFTRDNEKYCGRCNKYIK